MARQIKRRGPCPCGSGNRYKNCCEPKAKGHIPGMRAVRVDEASLSPEHHEFVRQLRSQPAAVVANQIPWSIWGGHRWVAVGPALQRRPIGEAFSNFLIGHLKATLGREWWDAELAHPPNARGQISVLLRGLHDWQVENEKHPENRLGRGWSAPASGHAMAALTLAYDIYSLNRSGSLPPRLLNRLRAPAEFQGARYEVAVAAILYRAGCEVSWTSDGPGRRCEFVATHGDTKELVAVEAKSRRRPGALGHPGAPDPDESKRADVQHLIENAIGQAPVENIPFFVFVDVNQIPLPAAHPLDLPWFPSIDKWLEEKAAGTPEAPCPFTAIIVTNYSHHWSGSRVPPQSVSVISQPAKHSSRPRPSEDFLRDFLRSLGAYSRIPVPWLV